MKRLPLICTLLLAFAGSATATTVLDMPISELAQRSALVLRAKVIGKKVSWNAAHDAIHTDVDLRVSKALKGKPAAVVSVRQFHGTLDGVANALPGDPEFVPGEEVVVFLEPLPGEPGKFVLTAMGAAKFVVRKTAAGNVAERNLDGLAFARRGDDGVIRPTAPSGPAALPLETLLKDLANLP